MPTVCQNYLLKTQIYIKPSLAKANFFSRKELSVDTVDSAFNSWNYEFWNYNRSWKVNKPRTATCCGSATCSHSSLPSQQSQMPSFTHPDVIHLALPDDWNEQ